MTDGGVVRRADEGESSSRDLLASLLDPGAVIALRPIASGDGPPAAAVRVSRADQLVLPRLPLDHSHEPIHFAGLLGRADVAVEWIGLRQGHGGSNAYVGVTGGGARNQDGGGKRHAYSEPDLRPHGSFLPRRITETYPGPYAANPVEFGDTTAAKGDPRAVTSCVVARAAARPDGGHLLSLRSAERRPLSRLGGDPAEGGTRGWLRPPCARLVAGVPRAAAVPPPLRGDRRCGPGEHRLRRLRRAPPELRHHQAWHAGRRADRLDRNRRRGRACRVSLPPGHRHPHGAALEKGRCPLQRRDVLVAVEDVVGVVPRLELSKARERLVPEGGTQAIDRLVRLHVVDVAAAADRPWLDRGRGVARPL